MLINNGYIHVYSEGTYNPLGRVGEGVEPSGVQMNTFLNLHPTGLLYRFMHNIPMFK